MQIEFNKTGAERKALVSAISSITGEKAVYQFMPTCAYKIGNFTVTKDGALEFDDRIDSEDVETLLDQLAQQGFTAAETNMAEPEEPMGLTISVPLDKVNCGNLTRLLEAKGGLIRKALCGRTSHRNQRGQGFFPLVFHAAGAGRMRSLLPFYLRTLRDECYAETG